jgi:2-methylcitrate dehydratase PrpD
MRRVGLGILIGIAASAGVILVYRAVEAQPGPRPLIEDSPLSGIRSTASFDTDD